MKHFMFRCAAGIAGTILALASIAIALGIVVVIGTFLQRFV